MRRWVHRTTVKQIVAIQKNSSSKGIADSMYECMGAFLLFGAIDQWLKGNKEGAQVLANKVQFDKFTDTEMLLRVQARISDAYKREDPFTDTCVAAHQQWRDWQKLTNGHTEEQLARITARHAMYAQCQPELNPAIKEPA